MKESAELEGLDWGLVRNKGIKKTSEHVYEVRKQLGGVGFLLPPVGPGD